MPVSWPTGETRSSNPVSGASIRQQHGPDDTGRGLCYMHYERWRRHGDTDSLRNDLTPTERGLLLAALERQAGAKRLPSTVIGELAEKLGRSRGCVRSLLCRLRKGVK